MLLSPHPDSIRGAARDRHERRKQDAVDVRVFSALMRADEDSFTDERRRVVLIPRRWDQVLRTDVREATVAKKPGAPRRARISRKPSRRECRLIRLNLWSLPPAFLFAGGPWVRPAPGIPCALLFLEGDASERNSGGLPSRERAVMRLGLFDI